MKALFEIKTERHTVEEKLATGADLIYNERCSREHLILGIKIYKKTSEYACTERESGKHKKKIGFGQ